MQKEKNLLKYLDRIAYRRGKFEQDILAIGEDVGEEGEMMSCDINFENAIALCEKENTLLENGDPEDIRSLAMCYYNGIGVEKDYVKAYNYFEKSANGGHDDAMMRVGYCLYYGKGVETSEQKAIEWFTKSAENGNENAQRFLKYYK